MNSPLIQNLKKEMIYSGRQLWEKDLASGLNGNISMRVDAETILITAHGTCLGNLQEKDILPLEVETSRRLVSTEGQVSTEKLLHTEIYKFFPEAKAVLHTHTTFTNAFFIHNDHLKPKIFETKMVLGEIRAVPQLTPAVTDAGPVIEAFKSNNIVVLKNHGVVAKGENLFDCFLLIQALEEAVKIDVFSRLYEKNNPFVGAGSEPARTDLQRAESKKYKLFSQEQVDEIVRLVNSDPQLKELGEKTKMTMDLAVQLNETGTVHSFSFENGNIRRVGKDPNVEFLISAPENIWRSVFNREIDPFVATTQKKMNLRGDFAKISKWYAPCSRVFELWQKVPVE